MFRARGAPPHRQLPDEVYRELVGIMFRSTKPLINLTVVLTGIGGLMFVMTGDSGVGALTLASLGLTLLRIGLNFAYRRRSALKASSLGEFRNWEIAFGAGAVLAGSLLGLLNMRALYVGDVGVHMLVAPLTFGFCAGAVIRLSVRPRIAALTLFSVNVLTLYGFVAHTQTNDGQLALAYGGQAFLLVMFGVGAIEMVNHIYRTTLLQLMTKVELSHLARKDPLTGLANRISLRERFDHEVVKLKRSGDFIALHFLDLDRFKVVNDNHGHPTGDKLLQAVAARLERMLRAGDTAARLGGDEFVVLQAHIRDPAEAEMLARRIVKDISAPYSVDGKELHIGASVGVTIAPTDGVELDHLTACGDSALYQAKTTKRGTVGFWQPPRPLVNGAA